MKISIPTPLRSYTKDRGFAEASGATLADVLADLDRQYPGIRFRIVTEQNDIRKHIKIFINEEQARDLSEKTRHADTVHIICALSGG